MQAALIGNEDGKMPLAGDWGRTNDEAELSLPGDEDGLGLGRKGPQLHQHDGSSNRRNRHHRVHDDAELAMIGVSRAGMKVRDLGDGEQDKQDKTQSRDYRKEPGAILPAEKRLNCRQNSTSTLLFYKTTHSVGRAGRAVVARRYLRLTFQ
jgi:hypothetical protein